MGNSRIILAAATLVCAIVIVPLIAIAPLASASEVPVALAPLATPVLIPEIPLIDAAVATSSASTAPIAAEQKTTPAAMKLSRASPVNAEKTDYPVRLIIPSIGLDDPVDQVGVDSDGAMSVPSGNTDEVGWYRLGTIPGNVGSAVIDAHVFAAFSKLKDLAVGSDIYVMTSGSKELHFIVADAETYPLSDVPAQTLFNRADASRLNLITCAGQLTADHSTYDHRLVVYAILVGNAT